MNLIIDSKVRCLLRRGSQSISCRPRLASANSSDMSHRKVGLKESIPQIHGIIKRGLDVARDGSNSRLGAG